MARPRKSPTPSAAVAPAPIRFRGTPAALAAVVADEVDRKAPMVLGVVLRKGDREPVEVMVQTDFDPRILRVSLPAELPPGRYEAVLQANGSRRPARLEVDAAPRLRVIPEQLRLDAHPGDLVGVDLTVLNQGNVPVTIRRVQAVGIFMEGGIERALRSAYVQKLGKGQRRMDAIADSLAAAHGGLLRIKLERGAGEIAPGEIRELNLIVHVPTGLEAGALYGGTWEVPGLVYPVNVQVAGEAPMQEEDGGGKPEDGKDVPRTPAPAPRRARRSK
jgi:hypothetical protein